MSKLKQLYGLDSYEVLVREFEHLMLLWGVRACVQRLEEDVVVIVCARCGSRARLDSNGYSNVQEISSLGLSDMGKEGKDKQRYSKFLPGCQLLRRRTGRDLRLPQQLEH